MKEYFELFNNNPFDMTFIENMSVAFGLLIIFVLLFLIFIGGLIFIDFITDLKLIRNIMINDIDLDKLQKKFPKDKEL